MDDSVFEEYAIMVWRKISREVRERQRQNRRQSAFRNMWEWFFSSLNN